MDTLAEHEFPVNDHTVAHALEWFEAASQQADWPARTVFKLRLSLDETLTNIAMYAFADAPPGFEPRVKLRLRQGSQRAVLDILDNGVAFDPTAQTPRELDTSLDDAQIGGHGLRLMLHYLESIRYERVGDWNQLELVAVINEAP